MAKELPYFRFTASEWLNDDISLESYELKGLFIDVCSFYWFKDCSINIALLHKRFNNAEDLLHELRELDIIKYNEDNSITIKFLDEQYDLLSEKRKKRSEAGRIGGLKKSSNAKAMLKQKPSYKDKDKDKDNIYVYNQFYDEQLELSDNDPDYKLLISWLFGDNIYMEPLEKVLSMKKQIRWDQFPGLLKMHKDSGVKVKPILEDLENWLMKNPKAKNSTVIGTLRTFIKNQQNKK
jgi:hypothetical protein